MVITVTIENERASQVMVSQVMVMASLVILTAVDASVLTSGMFSLSSSEA